ncbi:16696_t:CDS:2, partial [Funneliformis geosporum]
RESVSQNSSSNTAYVSESINNIEKTDVLKITNCTSSELSHKTEVIEDIANSAVDLNTINDWNASEKIRKTISLGYDQKSLEEIKSKADYQDKSVVRSSIITEFIQDLLEELLLSDNRLLKDVKFSSSKTIILRSIIQEIDRLQQSEQKLQLSVYSYKDLKTRVRKINKLFGFDPVTLKKINDISGYMVNWNTCNSDRILKLTNLQIEYIIKQIKSKITTSPVNKISETMATTSAHDSNSDDSDANELL